MHLKLLILSLFLISCNTIEPNTKLGCLDNQACNYDSTAIIDNNSCIYTTDCDGVCGGTAILDECSVCGGNVTDVSDCDDVYGKCPDGMRLGCDGICASSPSLVDECGICGGTGIANGSCDCVGNVEDCAGECGGSAVEDCAGECGGIAIEDACGVCGGDGIPDDACDCAGNVEDCAGVCNGTSMVDCTGECGGIAIEDECGVCGGDNSTCTRTVDIMYNSDTPIGGFQFYVSGIQVTGVSGGAAAAAGFLLSTGNNTVIGFSLSGATIPSGEGILVLLNVAGSGVACISSEENLIISDNSGNALDAMVDEDECNTIYVP